MEGHRLPLWPTVGLGICLFLLSVLATVSWRPRTPVPDVIAPPSVPAPSTAFVGEPPLPTFRPVGTHRGSSVAQSAEIRRSLPLQLEELAGPQHVAPIHRQVGHLVAAPPPLVRTDAGDWTLVRPDSDVDVRSLERRNSTEPTEPQLAAPGDDPPLTKSPPDAVPDNASVWPRPTTLLQQLDELVGGPAADWAASVQVQLSVLHGVSSLAAAEAGPILERLTVLTRDGHERSARLSGEDRSALLRATFGLGRRLAVWQQVHRLAVERRPERDDDLAPQQPWAETLAAVTERLDQVKRKELWREYVHLDQLPQLAPDTSLPESERRRLARHVLARLKSPFLSERQHEFFTEPPFQDLERHLRYIGYEPIDLLDLLDGLERYERDGFSDRAHSLAEVYHVLHFAPSRDWARVGEQLDTYYRNANLRTTISKRLLQRLVPSPEPITVPVERDVEGSYVTGQAQTTIRMSLDLVPDLRRWRVQMRATGNVSAETASYAGPAVFYGQGESTFEAQKVLVADRRGFHLADTQTQANSDTYLTGLQTEYDAIPFFGLIAQSRARREYEARSSSVRDSANTMVQERVKVLFDREVQQNLERARGLFHKQWVDPLYKLDLNPIALDMQTSPDELVARFRVAADHQLGSHTPRPRPPTNNWFSLQMHESAMNNLFEQLRLAGREASVTELSRDLADVFNRPNPNWDEELTNDVSVRFAEHDPLRVQCADGRLMLTIRVDELVFGRRVLRDFQARAYYAPRVQSLRASLARDGIVELRAPHLGLRDQVLLRGIFSKVLSQNRPLTLIPDDWSRRPSMHDLEVQQFEVRHGWIALAVGPKNQARENVADQRK